MPDIPQSSFAERSRREERAREPWPLEVSLEKVLYACDRVRRVAQRQDGMTMPVFEVEDSVVAVG
jgi:hypothetical protein